MSRVYDVMAVRVIVPDIPDCYEALGNRPQKIPSARGTDQRLYFPSQAQRLPLDPHDRFRAGGKNNRNSDPHSADARRSRVRYRRPLDIFLGQNLARFLFPPLFARGNSGKRTALGKTASRMAERNWPERRGISADLRIDFFQNHIFAFTPKGDIIDLPEDATPIDFAYAVHSEIGARTTGAKVDGKLVPLDYKVKNGQVVEILTSKDTKTPNQDWLRIARTSYAKGRIRQQLRKAGIMVGSGEEGMKNILFFCLCCKNPGYYCLNFVTRTMLKYPQIRLQTLIE